MITENKMIIKFKNNENFGSLFGLKLKYSFTNL